MTAPHDAPTAVELLSAVREWIENDVMAATDGRLKFHARVAANMLGMVEREIELGADQEIAHLARLDALGASSDADLAARIRARDLDDRADEVRELLTASVIDKLTVANPKYLASP
ncbi:MAG: DUF6285 domain-containing protein [Ilumatobacteraceae bacterium]